ncbi:MAG: hypothetical protein HC837_21640 [Chloroflexaceae bacterium]|nr:hypothetical protein [Chloroflexaceae bacterium]
MHFRHAGRAVAAWLDGHVSLEAPAALALPEKWSVAGQRPGGVVP